MIFRPNAGLYSALVSLAQEKAPTEHGLRFRSVEQGTPYLRAGLATGSIKANGVRLSLRSANPVPDRRAGNVDALFPMDAARSGPPFC